MLTQRTKPDATRDAAHAAAPSAARVKGSSFARAAAAQLGGVVSNAALNMYLAIYLSPAGYGDFAIAVVIALLTASLAIRGYDTLTTRFVASRFLDGGSDEPRVYIAYVRRRALIDGAVMGGVIALTAGVAVATGALGAALTLIATAMRVPFICRQRIDESVLRGRHEVFCGLASLWLTPTLALGMILCLPTESLTAAVATQALLIATAVTCVWTAAVVKRRAPSLTQPTAVVATLFQRRQWSQEARPFALLTVAMAAQSQSGILIAGWMLGAEAAGLYGVASKLMLPLLMVVEAVALVVSPRIAAAHAMEDRDGLQQLLSQAGWIAFPATTVLVAGLWFAADPVLAWIGPEYVAASLALKILSLGPLIHVACGPVGQSLSMAGHGWVTFRGVLAGLVVSLSVSLLLAPWVGIEGVATGATAGLATWSIWLAVSVRRLLGVNSTVAPWKRAKPQPLSTPYDSTTKSLAA